MEQCHRVKVLFLVRDSVENCVESSTGLIRIEWVMKITELHTNSMSLSDLSPLQSSSVKAYLRRSEKSDPMPKKLSIAWSANMVSMSIRNRV